MWTLKIFLLAGGLLVLQSLWAFMEGLRFLRLVRGCRKTPQAGIAPPAAVVIPCKGVDPGFDSNLERFLNQDYPDYQIIFAVATAGDSACRAIGARLNARSESGKTRKPRTSLVVAGLSDERGEKVNNLIRGMQAVDGCAQILVFADIDAAPSPDWLQSLVEPLASPQVTVSTGFRWYLPGNGFVSRLRAAWDSSIATMMGDHDHNFAWGGSMAIRAADFHALRVAERYWTNTVSDDFALTRAVREAGGKIAFAPRCLVASREESSFREFLRWSTRQIIITRAYAPHFWRLGMTAYLFYCGTFILGLSAVALSGASLFKRLAVVCTLLVVVLLGAGKGYIRSLVAREQFAAEMGGGSSCYWRLSPLVPWIMLWNFIVAGFSRRIEWRGTKYKLISGDKVRVMGRTAS